VTVHGRSWRGRSRGSAWHGGAVGTLTLGLLLAVAAVGATAAATGASSGAATTSSTTTPIPTTAPVPPGPQIVVEPAEVAVGDLVKVTTSAWPSGGYAVAEVCGNAGKGGSADCARSTGVGQPISADLTAVFALPIVAPPVACPCVVRVTSTSFAAAIAPLAFAEDPGGPASTATTVSRRLEVVGAEVVGGTWHSWWGDRQTRVLEVTLCNAGTAPVTDAPISVAVGKSDDPTGYVAPPQLGTIAPGATTVVRVPFDLEPLAFGTSTVRFEVLGLDAPVVASVQTSTMPWLAVVVPVVLLVLALVAWIVRRRTRRRRRRQRRGAGGQPAGDQGADDQAGDQPQVRLGRSNRRRSTATTPSAPVNASSTPTDPSTDPTSPPSRMARL
jgi:hypothetical protein